MNTAIDTIWHKWLGRPYALHLNIDQGQGTTIVLLHGIARDGSIWQPLVNQLDLTKYRVIAPDLLGFGQSAKPDWNSYDIEAHARAVLATIKKHHLARPIILAGHSMGCLIAAHIASLEPKLVKQLILYEPPLLVDMPEYRSYSRRRKFYLAFFKKLAEDPAAVISYSKLLRRTFGNIAELARSQTTWTPMERSLRNTIMVQGTFKELESIQVPTDIIYGRLDFVVIRSEVNEMFGGSKNLQFHTVTDMHGVSKRSAKFLAKLIVTPQRSQKHRETAEKL